MIGSSRVHRPVAIVLAAAIALSPAAWCEAGPKPAGDDGAKGCRVRAKLTASDGKKPVEGAVLRAYVLDSGKVYEAPPSNAKGECLLEGLPYGYLDLDVETKEGHFAGSQVVLAPPRGMLAVSVRLSGAAGGAPWWNASPPGGAPGSPTGAAEVLVLKRGREFWKSPWGIAILGVAATAALLAITGSESDGTSSTVAE